jgi:hypothetical protein
MDSPPIKEWRATRPPPDLDNNIPPLSPNSPQLLSTPATLLILALTIAIATWLIDKLLNYTPLGNGDLTEILAVWCGSCVGMWIGFWIVGMVEDRNHYNEKEKKVLKGKGKTVLKKKIAGSW